MIRRYRVSPEYLRFIESQLMIAIHDAVADQKSRARGDGPLNAWTAEFYDAGREGEAIIEIGIVDNVAVDVDYTGKDDAEIIPLPEPLKAAS